MEETQFFILADNRKLCFAQYGDPGGFPIVYCHGFPGSRVEARLGEAGAQHWGVRLIAIDRPGFGGSDFLRNRSMLDWPADVEALMKYLRINTFSVIGVSGGAPHAMSCAVGLKQQIHKLGIVCGLGWLGDRQNVNQMRLPFRLLLSLARAAPATGSAVTERLIARFLKTFPALAFSMIKSIATAGDRVLLNKPFVGECVLQSIKEAFCQGGAGPLWEFLLYRRPWGFDLRHISAETYLWHGDNDNTVPLAMGKRHAEIIPHAQLTIYPGEGHFSVPILHLGEIMQTLRKD